MPLNSDPQIDWLSRADGKPHTLRALEHYTRSETKVRRAASMWALRNGFRALTEIGPASITVKFVPREGKL
jgi:hypothetical protein